MKVSKGAYKPVGLALGSVSGLLAGMAFKKAWKLIEGQDEAPSATDEDRSWTEVLIAAAIQGVIFAVVKAGVDRSGAVVTRRFTGTWPT
ncbi:MULTISPECIES: DUF4235 domain-containing protein [unclassified Streptomyces]|uniref:DUF4235 domain-containing protein n=1 Tax=unclassified Streptomyces TaxID=2593676 RepID=UPI000DC7697C|nr:MULTISPECIES: DUF4235 domain-containing protein [unclassified Streptomyces]AWZ03923.1 hypothetical protein DRB89_03920 [Streptomyces sp. ICC4]AWZ13038.1 hypothetical protein DRB96_12745 [Streptomyces sp. ICC1]